MYKIVLNFVVLNMPRRKLKVKCYQKKNRSFFFEQIKKEGDYSFLN